MSTAAVLIVCASALVLAGMVFINAIPDVLRARADARLAAQPDAGGYSADIVEQVVRGALLTQGAPLEGAGEVAELVVDELERGLVFDGTQWRALAP